MRQNQTLQLIRQDQATIGLWLQTHGFHTARILAASGLLHWILLDLEHTPVDLSTASTILATIADVSGGACTPIARVAQGTRTQIQQALDAGAHGVIVPMIEDAESAANCVRFARYPPAGERGAGGLTPHLGFGTTQHVEYVAQANREILVSIQIETRKAVENIDAILDVPGIDLVFIGPFDLHLSLGLTPTLWSDAPVFQDAMKRVIAACRRRGLRYGTLSPTAEGAAARIVDGFRFVGLGTDVMHLLGALKTATQQVRTILSEGSR